MSTYKDQGTHPKDNPKTVVKPPVKGATPPTPNKHVKPLTKAQKYSGTT